MHGYMIMSNQTWLWRLYDFWRQHGLQITCLPCRCRKEATTCVSSACAHHETWSGCLKDSTTLMLCVQTGGDRSCGLPMPDMPAALDRRSFQAAFPSLDRRAMSNRHGHQASDTQLDRQVKGDKVQSRLSASGLPGVAPGDESVYADEAGLPLFAQLAAAHPQSPVGHPQQDSSHNLPSNRQDLHTIQICWLQAVSVIGRNARLLLL